MAANKGKDVTIKIGSGGTVETFATIGGLRNASMTINNQQVDISTKDTSHWRESLEGAGLSSVSLSGSGIFTDTASEETLRAAALADSIDNYEFMLGNGDKIAGAFSVANYERTGGYDDAATFSASFVSAGAITFTAA